MSVPITLVSHQAQTGQIVEVPYENVRLALRSVLQGEQVLGVIVGPTTSQHLRSLDYMGRESINAVLELLEACGDTFTSLTLSVTHRQGDPIPSGFPANFPRLQSLYIDGTFVNTLNSRTLTHIHLRNCTTPNVYSCDDFVRALISWRHTLKHLEIESYLAAVRINPGDEYALDEPINLRSLETLKLTDAAVGVRVLLHLVSVPSTAKVELVVLTDACPTDASTVLRVLPTFDPEDIDPEPQSVNLPMLSAMSHLKIEVDVRFKVTGQSAHTGDFSLELRINGHFLEHHSPLLSSTMYYLPSVFPSTSSLKDLTVRGDAHAINQPTWTRALQACSELRKLTVEDTHVGNLSPLFGALESENLVSGLETLEIKGAEYTPQFASTVKHTVGKRLASSVPLVYLALHLHTSMWFPMSEASRKQTAANLENELCVLTECSLTPSPIDL